jgi:hypothetical protein
MDDETQRAQRAKQGSPYLNTAQAAHYLGISQRHLERLRSKRAGPVFRLHTRVVQYHVDDLRDWSQTRARAPQA